MGDSFRSIDKPTTYDRESDSRPADFSKECWQQMSQNRLTEKQQDQSAQTKSQGFLDFSTDDPLLASSVIPSIRFKDKHSQAKDNQSNEASNKKQPAHDTHSSRHSLQSDHEHKPHKSAKPEHYLPEVHLHSHKTDHHKIPPKHHTQPTGNENHNPSDEDNSELEPGMILGGAGGAPPPGGENIRVIGDGFDIKEARKHE